MRACKFYVDDGELSFQGMSDNGLLSWLSPAQQVQAGLLTEQEQIEKEAEKAGARLSGYARQKLNKLYEQKKEIYVCIG